MNAAMRLTLAAAGALALAGAGASNADVLYDSLWIVDTKAMDAGTGNAIGGLRPFGQIIDAQMADDFVTKQSHRLTRLVADIMTHDGTVPAEGIWIQFYEHDPEIDGPVEDVFLQFVATPDLFTVVEIPTDLNFILWRIDIDLTEAGLELPAGIWWINPQPLDVKTNGDWFWWVGSVSVETIGFPSHVRDGWEDHGNAYGDLWGVTDWIPHDFRGNNSVSMRIEGVPTSGTTDLTGMEIVTGTLLNGDVNDLRESDDARVHTRSGFGRTISDLHKMEMVATAVTTVDSPVLMDLSVEARIGVANGVARLRVFNWNTNQFDQVAQYAIGTTEATFTVEDLNAADYVNQSGEIQVMVKHNVSRPFLGFTFESFVDWVEIVIE